MTCGLATLSCWATASLKVRLAGVVSAGSVHNQGIGGDDTAGVLRRLALVTDRRPGKVFLMIGTNDIGKGVSSVGEIVDNVAAIVDQIRTDSPTTEVYVQSVLPRLRRRADQVGSVNRGIETVAHDGEQRGSIYGRSSIRATAG